MILSLHELKLCPILLHRSRVHQSLTAPFEVARASHNIREFLSHDVSIVQRFFNVETVLTSHLFVVNACQPPTIPLKPIFVLSMEAVSDNHCVSCGLIGVRRSSWIIRARGQKLHIGLS